MLKIYSILFSILSIVFLAHYAVVGQAVYGDGIYYWAYTRSIYFDKDINFSNELSHRYNSEFNNKNVSETLSSDLMKTSKGLIFNKYPPLAPLVWLPFFAIADVVVIFLSIFFSFYIRNGFSDIYQIIVGQGNIFFLTLGIFFLQKFILLYSKNKSRYIFITCVLLLFTTNLFYYGSIDVLNSHPFSFLLSTIYFYLWFKTIKQRSFSQWFILGILGGLLAATRTLDSLLLLLPILYGLIELIRKNRIIILLLLKKYFVFVTGSALGFSPQLIIWYILNGTIRKNPYLGSGTELDFFHPHLLGLVFNLKTGFLFYSPILIVAFVGLYFLRRKNVSLWISLTIIVVLYFYIIASWNGWHQGESYGMRMFISLFPIFALGLYEILLIVKRHLSLLSIYLLSFIFIAHNVCMILFFLLFLQSQTVDMGKITQDLIFDKLLHLF